MPIARSFYFIRHGQTDWNQEKRMQGLTDIPLNATGKAQARAALETLENTPIDLIVVSHLSRAKETAEILNTILRTEMVVDPRICERNYGELEGKTLEERDVWEKKIFEEFPDRVVAETGYPDPPNGEAYTAFKSRILNAFNEHLTAKPDTNILFVSHGGVYRVLYRAMLNDLQSSDNATPYFFNKAQNRWTIDRL